MSRSPMSRVPRRSGWLAASTALFALAMESSGSAEQRRPNILVIVADDMGYSDLGAFGGEIETPNLDRLARRGTRFTGFYTAPACSPTRAMLMTGSDSHAVGLGTMSERITDRERGRPGYEGYLSARAATIAERLKASGYRTVMSGKWHLGKDRGQLPSDRGFDRSFALLQGGHNHFGFDQSRDYRAVRGGPEYRLDGNPANFPVGDYSSDHFTNRLMKFLKAGNEESRPFFAYLAFTAPHWPLHARPAEIAKYRGRYDDGPEALRASRLVRMKALGIVPRAIASVPFEGPNWSSLSPEQRAFEARKMEVYAAMVDRMDQNVGRLLAELRQSGQLDNTIIFFMSDNGPDGWELSKPLNLGSSGFVDTPIDNSGANIGAPDSYLSYGPAWAQAGAAPFRGLKGGTSEGGIRTAAIVAGPGVAAGHLTSAWVHVMDIAPTIAALTTAPAAGALEDRELPSPEGRSLAALLTGGATAIRGPQDSIGWELFYNRAIRRGDLKAVYPAAAAGKPAAGWQLFDLSRDPGETRDLARDRPQALAELVQLWEQYAVRNHVLVKPADEGGSH